jgi:oligopeptidase A
MPQRPAELADNPLLIDDGLPPFDRIESAHIVPAVRQLLAESREKLERIEADVEPAWASAIDRLDALDRPFERTWGPVSHLFGVKNSSELREAYDAVRPEVVEFGLRLSQSEPIYRALKGIRDGAEWERLDATQRRILEKKIQSADLAGVGLTGDARGRFNEIAKELSQLGTDFSNHVLDATKAFAMVLTERAEVEGLPPSALQLAAQSYNQTQSGAGETATDGGTEADGGATADGTRSVPATLATPEGGPWRITLDIPSYGPFMQHAKRGDLRERLYRALIARAAEGDLDNSPLIPRILALRQEQAELLGFRTFAEMSLARKMAPSVEAIEQVLETLRQSSWTPAERDMDDLRTIAREHGVAGPLNHWDTGYWAERLREQRFQFTDEELRPYFSLDRVLQGMFELVHRLFGITVKAADGQGPVWHPDVRFFEISDETGKHIASFYLDPYSRPENKRGGAWMDDCLGRRRDAARNIQLPVAHLVCNSTPPVGPRPSLMTFREVETLFHEFGHGLQHMLTTIDYAECSGISGVEWDAVELPSQFMENWCYHKPTLLGMTAHFETGEPLPEELFEKIVAAKTYRAGSMMLRQLMLGLTDLELHHRFKVAGTLRVPSAEEPGVRSGGAARVARPESSKGVAGSAGDPSQAESAFDVQRRISGKTSILPLLPEDRSLCSFNHIFAGGYAAGYYSYKWAEVLSADAFAAFEEAGLDDERAVRETGRRFRDTVLSLGGSRHPMDIFREFRGREPSPEPLLRHSGLA